jgi:sugar (pentulose or hexulose) kinase
MLEGMARIEGEAYALLRRLGASALTEVVTAGGGAVNPKWTALRAAALGVPVRAARQGEASYGAALLARQGWRQQQAERQQAKRQG